MIVEDNPNMSCLLTDILDFFDYKTMGAKDGEEALKILAKESFDMVITDLRMPKMGGIDLLRSIKNQFPGFRWWSSPGSIAIHVARMPMPLMQTDFCASPSK